VPMAKRSLEGVARESAETASADLVAGGNLTQAGSALSTPASCTTTLPTGVAYPAMWFVSATQPLTRLPGTNTRPVLPFNVTCTSMRGSGLGVVGEPSDSSVVLLRVCVPARVCV